MYFAKKITVLEIFYKVHRPPRDIRWMPRSLSTLKSRLHLCSILKHHGWFINWPTVNINTFLQPSQEKMVLYNLQVIPYFYHLFLSEMCSSSSCQSDRLRWQNKKNPEKMLTDSRYIPFPPFHSHSTTSGKTSPLNQHRVTFLNVFIHHQIPKYRNNIMWNEFNTISLMF